MPSRQSHLGKAAKDGHHGKTALRQLDGELLDSRHWVLNEGTGPDRAETQDAFAIIAGLMSLLVVAEVDGTREGQTLGPVGR